MRVYRVRVVVVRSGSSAAWTENPKTRTTSSIGHGLSSEYFFVGRCAGDRPNRIYFEVFFSIKTGGFFFHFFYDSTFWNVNYYCLFGATGVNYVLQVRGYDKNAMNRKFVDQIYKSKNTKTFPVLKKNNGLQINPVLPVGNAVTNKDSLV